MTTPEVAARMAEMAEPSDLDRILDPAAGTGELLLAAADRARRLQVTPQALVGIEIDQDLVEQAAQRLAVRAEVLKADFMELTCRAFDPTLVIANPPYGGNRELDFFVKCDREARPGTLLVFLMPMAFIDRVPDIDVELVEGRPLGVTTGHVIVRHRAGTPFTIRNVKRKRSTSVLEFEVLTGLKIYERGAGSPPQSEELIQSRPFTSETPRKGWLKCLRTGDLDADGIKPARLWVDYGPHLASPKELGRFSGPRLVLRRMPIWGDRRLCAHYIEHTELCAGDLLVIKHRENSREQLKALAHWIRSDTATHLIHERRPSVKHRDSFPKVSAKDIYWLIEHGWNGATS